MIKVQRDLPRVILIMLVVVRMQAKLVVLVPSPIIRVVLPLETDVVCMMV